MVYIELPSPISARTGRSGQAIAAPIAFGRPCPIAPPVSGNAVGAIRLSFCFDRVHPTDAGHQYLADKMYALISKTLATMATP